MAVTGFLYIECAKCGDRTGRFVKGALKYSVCKECGEKTDLTEPLKTLWLQCECGTRVRYKTNVTEKLWDMECKDCGAPVTVEWNKRKMVYAPVRE